ncbi:unnamed protein product [Microthlaspi erraticum]|uniref:Arabidopsis retrotransposon Orf1 C-terminal domain-containing protein n=1 Tax=Microthlaspi erraticum TaxID=1685480 RepID=A0A6D2JDP3_9BRAS|nr:unnamed protein product [Microthlaspi erraticum]
MRSSQRNQRNSDDSSRRRAEIVRGKRHVESEDDFELDEEMEDVESPRDLRDEQPVDPMTTEEKVLVRIFRKMKFAGTRYPDPGAMGSLRISDDVYAMFDNLGVGVLMSKRNESYKEATCQFLTSLDFYLCKEGEHTPDGSDGSITFVASGGRYYLSFQDIDRAYYLRPRQPFWTYCGQRRDESIVGSDRFRRLPILDRQIRSNPQPLDPIPAQMPDDKDLCVDVKRMK